MKKLLLIAFVSAKLFAPVEVAVDFSGKKLIEASDKLFYVHIHESKTSCFPLGCEVRVNEVLARAAVVVKYAQDYAMDEFCLPKESQDAFRFQTEKCKALLLKITQHYWSAERNEGNGCTKTWLKALGWQKEMTKDPCSVFEFIALGHEIADIFVTSARETEIDPKSEQE